MKDTETLSIAIMTLNEEQNIEKCIRSIGNFPKEKVRVWDGGSTDKTVQIAEGLGVKVMSVPGTSLAKRRGLAILNCDQDFLLFLDADQSLVVDPDQVVKKYFSDPLLAGVQFSGRAAKESQGYWAHGFGYRWQLITGTPGPRKVLGTPTIFRVSVSKIVKFDPEVSGSTDDTDFCYRLIQAGYKLSAIEEAAEERVRATFQATVKKAFWYGSGDAEFVKTFKPFPYGHVYHVLVRNFLVIPVRVLFKKPVYFVFFFVFGCARLVGFLNGMLKRKPNMAMMKS